MSAISGIRILDFSSGIAGPLATMLLSDFEAEVIKIEPPGGDPWQDHPGYLCWNRNKQRLTLDLQSYPGIRAARELIATADVALFDNPPGELEQLGLDAGTLRAANPRLLHAWFPTYGARGRWSQLPRADALLSAVTSGAFMQFSWDEVPVHLVSPQLSYAQGIAGAAALSAGLYHRARTGTGQSLVLSGLHAFAFVESGSALQAGELMRMRIKGSRGAMPNYHLYQCADGEWLFLGTLLQPHFLQALEAIDLLEILTMEGVDGDFANIRLPEVSPSVIEALAARFAERPRQEWLDILHDAGVPRGPVGNREDWFASETVAANEMRLSFEHPDLGRVDIPGVPITLHDTPGTVRGLVQDTTLDDVLARAPQRDESVLPADPSPPGVGPLEGVRVLDLGMIVAGTHAGTLLANYGADVIKVEPPDGDCFRPYGLGFVGFNQGKRSIVIDLKTTNGREAFYDLVRQADVVCDNYRPGVLERLGVDHATLSAINPRIITCSVTGYGSKGPLAHDPGVDPLLQAQSGLMAAQGGIDSEPVFHQIPVNDTATAMMSAFGIITALNARERTGKGQRIETCLANQSVILQSGEMVWYEGRPDNPIGSLDCPGETALRRVYQCSDGWIMLWCTEPEHYQSLAAALDHPEWAGRLVAEDALNEPREGETVDRIAEAFAPITVEDAIDRLHSHAVPAAPAVAVEDIFHSPWHRDNHLFWETHHPEFGPMTTVNTFAEWGGAPSTFKRRAPALGEHSREVLHELGYDEAQIESLLTSGAIRQYSGA